MENSNEIKVGNFTVSKTVLLNCSKSEAIDKFKHVDARIVAQAWTEANPKQKGRKKKEAKKDDETEV
jgi:hypothetical protein